MSPESPASAGRFFSTESPGKLCGAHKKMSPNMKSGANIGAEDNEIRGQKVLALNPTLYSRKASLVAQMVKCLSAMQETQVRSLSWDDPLEKEMAAHSSVLA